MCSRPTNLLILLLEGSLFILQIVFHVGRTNLIKTNRSTVLSHPKLHRSVIKILPQKIIKYIYYSTEKEVRSVLGPNIESLKRCIGV